MIFKIEAMDLLMLLTMNINSEIKNTDAIWDES